MQRYIFVRVLQTIVALWAVTVIVFALARITGNPLDTLLSFEATAEDRALVAAAWGLDRPLHVQYFTFVGNALRGQFGESFKWRMSAGELVVDRLPATLALAGLSIAIATAIAVPVGVITAVKRDSIFDYGGKALALIGQAAPPFLGWIGADLGFWSGSGPGTHVGSVGRQFIYFAGGFVGSVLGGRVDEVDTFIDARRAG